MKNRNIKFKICNEEQLNGFDIDPGAIWFSADTNLLSFDIIDNDGNEVRKSLKVKPEEIFDESSFVKKEDYQNLFENQDPSSGRVIDSSKLNGQTLEDIQTYIQKNFKIDPSVLSQYRTIENNTFNDGLNVNGNIKNKNNNFFISGQYGNKTNKIYTNLKFDGTQKIQFYTDETLQTQSGYIQITPSLSNISNIENYINKYFQDSSGQIYQVKSITWTKPNLNIECWKIINDNNFLFQIGNGTSDNHSNACLIDNNGNAYFSGEIFSKENKLITEEKVDALRNEIQNLEQEINNNIEKITNTTIPSIIQNYLSLSSIKILSVSSTRDWNKSPTDLKLSDNTIYFSQSNSQTAVFFQSKYEGQSDKVWFKIEFSPSYVNAGSVDLEVYYNNKWNGIL